MRHCRAVVGLGVLACLAGACSSGGQSIDTIAPTSSPPATLPPPDSRSTAPVDTSIEPTTTTEASATTVVPDGVAHLSADGPWRLVDSAPGVTTPGLVYELMPKLWAFLPTEESDDDGNLYVPSPADIPIIEAYLQAVLVYYRAITVRPIDLESPGWKRYFVDGGQSYFDVLRPRRDGGQVADLDAGTVLRPRVLGEARTEATAIVFDCALDGGVFLLPDGSLAPGSTRGVSPVGTAAPMTVGGNGEWITEYIVRQAEACT